MCLNLKRATGEYFTKRRIILIIIGSRFLLMGFEYAIILPTLVLFLQKMSGNFGSENSQSSFSLSAGLSLSAMSFSALITAPIFGRISDKTRTTKTAVIIGNLCEIIGSLMYSFSRTPTLLVLSRLVAGIGISPSASILGMVGRSTLGKYKTSTISMLYSMRQIGLIVGPSFNLFLREPILHFWIGSFSIDTYTLPTFFMAILWLIHIVLVFFLYDDLPPSLLDGELSENNDNQTIEDHLLTEIESRSIPSTDNNQTENDNEIEKKEMETLSFFDMFRDVLSEEGIACLGSILISATIQLGMEAAITPITHRLFGWTALENSIFFLISGILYTIGLLVLAKLSHQVSDHCLALFGSAAMVANNLIFLVFSICSTEQPEKILLLTIFLIYGVIYSLLFPYAFTPIVSLVSKISNEKNQGFMQGAQILTVRFGMILGPIWTTAMVDQYISTMAAVNLAISIIPVIMFAASYQRFKNRLQ